MRRVRESPGGDHEYVRFRLRMVAAGVGASYVICATLAVWMATTWTAPHRHLIAALTVVGVVGTTVVAFVPAEPIVRSRWREPFFLAWSLMDIGLITAVAAADGGAHSPTALIFFLTLVFAAVSYPIASVIAVSGVSVVAFVGLAVLVAPFSDAERAGSAYVWFFAVCLALVGALCVWQSQMSSAQRAELLRLSRTDPLTGALNRLGFAERFAEEIAEARRHERGVGLIVLDLDGFKAVNDTLGHAAGDDLLCWVASTLNGLMRPGDVTGRLGGDEFTVLLRDTEGARLAAVAERVRAALAERIGATTGLASFPAGGENLDTLLYRADQDMYATRAATGRTPAAR